MCASIHTWSTSELQDETEVTVHGGGVYTVCVPFFRHPVNYHEHGLRQTSHTKIQRLYIQGYIYLSHPWIRISWNNVKCQFSSNNCCHHVGLPELRGNNLIHHCGWRICSSVHHRMAYICSLCGSVNWQSVRAWLPDACPCNIMESLCCRSPQWLSPLCTSIL